MASEKGDIWSIGALVLDMLSSENEHKKDYKINETILHKLVSSVLPNQKDEIFKNCLIGMLKTEPSERFDT